MGTVSEGWRAVLYRISLLGGFELHVGDGEVRLPGSAQRLTALLALQRRPLARVCVAGRLWPDASEAHAHASLRSALWRTHRAAAALIEVRDDRLGLRGSVAVDRQELVAWAQRLISGDDHLEGDFGAILADHDLLPGWQDDWVVMERERLRHLRLHALEALARRLAGLGRFSDAIDVAYEAIGGEPLRESAHRVLIDVHLAEGTLTRPGGSTGSAGGSCRGSSASGRRRSSWRCWRRRDGDAAVTPSRRRRRILRTVTWHLKGRLLPEDGSERPSVGRVPDRGDLPARDGDRATATFPGMDTALVPRARIGRAGGG